MPRLLPLAFIGANQANLEQLPCEWLDLFVRVAAFTAHLGHPIHTGAAPGCDQLAAEAALGAGGSVHLFLPWPKYEAGWIKELQVVHGESVSLTVYARELHTNWEALVENHHRHPGALGPKGRKLMGRIGGVVERCAGVVALPPNKEDSPGGIDYGMTLARAYGIEVWDLRKSHTRAWWAWRLERRAMTGEEFKTYLAHLDPARFVPGVVDQARRLAEIAPQDPGPRSVSAYGTPGGRLLSVTWQGHHCSLQVIVHPDGYETHPDFLEEGVSDPRGSWMFTEVTQQLAHLRDSLSAGAAGLTVAEWRSWRGSSSNA